MSRSRLSRCLLLAATLAALAPAAASGQPLAPASLPCNTTCSTVPAAAAPAPACLPTCGSDVYTPPASRQHRPNHTAVALVARRAELTSDAGLAAHRLDLADQLAATTVHSSDAGLAVHRLDLSEPTAAATARPACLPTCGSASVAPRVTPVDRSALAKANA